MDTPIFKQIASSLSVKLICTPILQTEVRADSILGDYRYKGFIEPERDPSGLNCTFHPLRVIDADDKLIGMLWDGDACAVEHEELDETTVGDIMDPIGPSKLVSSETSILDLVALFADKTCHTYYVLHRNEIIGAVQYDDLFKPIGRLAFLALP